MVLGQFNARYSYLEAYDIKTGELVWFHQDQGMIVSFIIVDSKIIFRNYHKIKALDINTGEVLWSKATKGKFSTIAGE